ADRRRFTGRLLHWRTFSLAVARSGWPARRSFRRVLSPDRRSPQLPERSALARRRQWIEADEQASLRAALRMTWTLPTVAGIQRATAIVAVLVALALALGLSS